MKTATIDNTLWSDTADLGTYHCHVGRTSDRQALLTVRLHNGAVLHEQPVTLGDGGPDVRSWQDICLDVIDHPAKRSNGIHG